MSHMKPLDVCCPICWGMPDNGYDDTTRKECIGDGRVANGVHPQRVELAEWVSEPLREWCRGRLNDPVKQAQFIEMGFGGGSDGGAHDTVKAVVESSLVGEGMSMHLQSPVEQHG